MIRYFAILLLLSMPLGPAHSAPVQQQAKIDLSHPATDTETNTKQARYVMERTLDALGGNRYLSITDYKQIGRGYGFYHNESQGVGLNYWRTFHWPDRERYDYFFQRDTYQFIKSKEWAIIHIGDRGWESTFRGAREETAKELEDYNRRRQYELDTVLRSWVPDPKTTLFYEGETIEATKEVYKVNLLSPKNLSLSLYVDRKTFLPIKKTFTYRDPVYKDIQEEADLYDKYRDEQGFMTPHVITRTKNDDIVSQRFITKWEFDVAYDENKFTPPAINYDKMKKY